MQDLFWKTNMAIVLLFWTTTVAAVTSSENALYLDCLPYRVR